jgi:phage/conjugal plasmid C-4 type zinc finger TraR family protein
LNDSADRADPICELQLKEALAAHANSQRDVSQIRINGDVICVDCDAVILQERVSALPTCVRCITCQEIQETRDKQWK